MSVVIERKYRRIKDGLITHAEFIKSKIHGIRKYRKALEVIAEHYGITLEQMFLPYRYDDISNARSYAMMYVREVTNHGITWVGLTSMFYIESCHHSNAIHMVGRMEFKRRNYEFEKKLWEELRPHLEGSYIETATFIMPKISSLQFRNYAQH